MPKRPRVPPSGTPTLFEMGKPQGLDLARRPSAERPYQHQTILLGTSSFTASGWSGSFYPAGIKSSEYLAFYADHFKTVEIDSTYYAIPKPSTATGWYRKTPPDFVFAAKVPGVITHDKKLVDCWAEFDEFLSSMVLLDEKLGPLLLQFPFFSKYEFPKSDEFLRRLSSFLRRTSEMATCKFAVEIRNTAWLDKRLTDLLGEYGAALALTDTNWVPRPWEMKEPLELVTADFAYVRWLGNRKAIEEQTTTWDKAIVDRTDDLGHWVNVFQQMINDKRIRKIFAFANNHYAGHGPATIKCFWELWNRK